MTTVFRVTEGSLAARTTDNLQLQLQKMAELQDQMSSGKRIRKPSDDPAGTTQAMQYRADQERVNQYNRNAQDATGWLGTADSALSSAVTAIQRVRTLVTEGANGTSDDTSRKALAAEIAQVKQSLVGLANTTYNNRQIFAGTANPAGQTPPKAAYDDDGTYNGNSGAVSRTIGSGATVQVNLDGPSVWGTPGINDMWHLLDDIQSHLTSSDPADQNKLTSGYTDVVNGARDSDLDRLDAMSRNIQNREAEVGARYNRVQTMQDRANTDLITIASGLSSVEDLDLPKTIMAIQLQNTAYQAALSATAKVIQPSLVDFLS